MSNDVDLEKVLEEARKIVRNAIDADEITNLTPRIVRARIEEALGLPAKVLDGPEYKSAISEAVNEVTSQREEEQERTVKKVQKRKTSENKRQTKRIKRQEPSDDKAAIEEAIEETSKSKSMNIQKFTPNDVENKSSKAGLSKKSASGSKVVDTDEENARGRKRGKKFLSPDTIDDSAIEMDSPVVASTSKLYEPVKTSVKVQSSSSKDAAAKSNSRKTEASPAKARTLEKDDQKSESEMSILEDEPPTRRGKSKTKAEPKASEKAKESKKSRAKKPAHELSKDEETIKRLKSFVVACGVRKAWAKEFKDLGTPSQQIKRLKEILSDLGMSGRMSLEQAKSIRAQREFAQELEDVKSFEQAVVGQGIQKSRSSAKVSLKSESEDDQESESGEDAVPVKKRLNARRSIMAFLEDQSDEE